MVLSGSRCPPSRSVAAPSSSALFPVLEEWCEEFPQPSSFTPCRGSEQETDGHDACDLMPGLKAQQSPGDAATLEAGSEAVGQSGRSGKDLESLTACSKRESSSLMTAP